MSRNEEWWLKTVPMRHHTQNGGDKDSHVPQGLAGLAVLTEVQLPFLGPPPLD